MNVRELMDSHEWCLVCFTCFTPSLSQIRVIHSTQLRSLISDNPGQIPVNKWYTWDKELSPTKEFPYVWTILLNISFLKHKIHLQSLNIIWLLNVDHFHDLWILDRRGWVIKYIIKYVTVKQKFKEAFYSIRLALLDYLLNFDVAAVYKSLVLHDDFLQIPRLSSAPPWPRPRMRLDSCQADAAWCWRCSSFPAALSSVYDAVRQCLLLCYDASQSRSYTLSLVYYSILTTIKPLFTF